jgi:hypothetical protein
MAILAFIRSVREIEIGMAIAACHGSMASAERKASLRMVEPDLARDDLPILGCVTRPTRNIEFAVRALSRCRGSFGLRSRNTHRPSDHRQQQNESITEQYDSPASERTRLGRNSVQEFRSSFPPRNGARAAFSLGCKGWGSAHEYSGVFTCSRKSSCYWACLPHLHTKTLGSVSKSISRTTIGWEAHDPNDRADRRPWGRNGNI